MGGPQRADHAGQRCESKEPRFHPSPFPPGDTRAEMTIPLIFDGQVVGVLDLQSDRINAFSEDDRFLCEALADNVAAAIHNADLYRTERWRRQVADSLREVAGLISADVGLEDVLDSILRELERNLPCDVAAIWLLEGDNLYLAQAHGADIMEIDNAAHRWPEAYDFLASALTAEQPVIRKPDDPIGPTGTALGFSADYSSIAAGLRAGDRPLGVLTLSHHTAGRYGHEAQAMTATFANYAAVAIENARLYDSAQEQAYASAALLQVAQAVAKFEQPGRDHRQHCPHHTHPGGCESLCDLSIGSRNSSTQPSPMVSRRRPKPACGTGILPPGIFPCWIPSVKNAQMVVGLLPS